MCGIAGICNQDPRVPVDEARLLSMREVLVHRGPDGQGLMLDGPVGFAHTRLAIIDVAGGEQPMCNEDGSVRIVYNGEIYNHAALRCSLQARGHTYRTRCDTESILHLYEEEGSAVVDRLQGMFAFAIWDRRRGRLLLARDRLGIKPLYYAVTDTGLVFASEIKALLASGLVRAAFDEDVLPAFLATRYVSGERTFFKGVRKVLPGHVLIWSAGERVQAQRYWHLPPPADAPFDDRQHAVAHTRELLETAVESHLMSDVPLGVFLSGGIDSTALTALVARAASGRVKTFAVGFSDREADELPYARLAADRLGTDHYDVTLSPQAFVDALPQLLWHEDEPIAFPSSVPLHFVARLARDHVKVVLTGEGADELFLGYNRYRVTRWNDRLGRALLGGGAPCRTSGAEWGGPRHASEVGPNCPPDVRGAGTGHPRSVFRQLRRVAAARTGGTALPAGPARRSRSICRGAALVRRGQRRAARSNQPRRPADLFASSSS